MPFEKVISHAHNGVDAPFLDTADWLTIVSAPPTGTGRQGEMILMDTGSTYSIFIWLNGAWREFPYTP